MEDRDLGIMLFTLDVLFSSMEKNGLDYPKSDDICWLAIVDLIVSGSCREFGYKNLDFRDFTFSKFFLYSRFREQGTFNFSGLLSLVKS